jgi:hypothetical protein
MADDTDKADNPKRVKRVETVATILLAVAAVATAWSSYQSAHWRGDQAVHSGRSIAARVDSSSAATHAGQLTQIDIATFTQWINATVAGNTELADFYRARFRNEFKPAFDAWLAQDPLHNSKAPPTPFAMSQYVVSDNTKAEQLNTKATVESATAAASLKRGDDYMLAVVLFAVSLFFAGISTKLHSVLHREILLAMGMIIFAGTFIWVATLPKFVT